MKKFLVAVLLFIPIVSFAAPSVRMLGTKSTTGTAVADSGSSVKTTTSVKVNQTLPVRAANNVKLKTSNLSGAISDSGSRFPAVTTAKTYSSATDSKVPTVSGTVITDDTVNTIIQAVENNIHNNYYNKTEVIQAVKDIDDPRIDAIRTVNPKGLHSATLPNDYIYVWIEKTNN